MGVFLYSLSTSRVDLPGLIFQPAVWTCCFLAWLLADWDFTQSAIWFLVFRLL